jgi:hypothetical protein
MVCGLKLIGILVECFVGLWDLWVWVFNVNLFDFTEFGFCLWVIVGNGMKVICVRLYDVKRGGYLSIYPL